MERAKFKHKDTADQPAVKGDLKSKSGKRTKRIQLGIIAILVGIAGISALLLSFAATAVNIYLSPATVSVQQGGTVTMALRINPNGANTDGVSATITYDPTKLQLGTIDASASPYTVSLQQSTTSNSLTITRAIGLPSGGVDNPVTTDSLVANINFTALTGSGTASLTLSNQQATYNGTDTGPTVTNATVNLTTPPPPTVSIGNSLTSTTIVSTDLVIATGQPNAQLNSSTYAVSVSPTDNSGAGIKQVDLLLDGTLNKTLTPTTGFSSTLNLSGLSCGSHTLTATVTDKAATPKTGSTTVTFKAAKSADVNADSTCKVDLADYNAVRTNYGNNAASLSDQRIDVNRNGTVDLSDYSAVRTRYGN